jgi:hypothetical protein
MLERFWVAIRIEVQMKKNVKPDYFKLPFKVQFGDIPVRMIELYVENHSKRFSDVKAVKYKSGTSVDPLFICRKNTGKELQCFASGSVGDVPPKWLDLETEEDLPINYEDFKKVVIEGNVVRFVDLGDDDDPSYYDELEPTGLVLELYDLTDDSPSSFILDCNNTEFCVDTEGYPFGEDGDVDYDQDSLFEAASNDFNADTADTLDFQTAANMWFSEILAKYYPKDTKLKLSNDVEL